MLNPAISDECADLLDAIVNRRLAPVPYAGRFMGGRQCIGTVVPPRSNMDGLPRVGAKVDHMGLGYIVYWPAHDWTPQVEQYLGIVLDESGRSEDDE